MKDLIVQRYNIVTVHSNGETFDDLREKPNGMFCYYKEANESHKEILAEQGEYVNESLIEALQAAMDYIDAIPKDVVLPAMPGFDRDWVDGVISKALGEE
ncbi:hypothetical protein [Citrobacter amalonaticus]|uniref:hypothetical protein n=1 Tax=Citrobacter amalonaticus TaxID=35703 RepID=UPI0035615A6A